MRAKANEILARLEVPHLADRFVTEMSSGEARRIMIGRALAHDPDTLLLDEPTNSLDLAAMQELRGVFRRLAQGGTGILLVTHHLSDIIPEIERVILIKTGPHLPRWADRGRADVGRAQRAVRDPRGTGEARRLLSFAVNRGDVDASEGRGIVVAACVLTWRERGGDGAADPAAAAGSGAVRV